MRLDTGNFSSRLSLLRLEEIEDYLYKTDINSQHLELAGGGTPVRIPPVRSQAGVKDVLLWDSEIVTITGSDFLLIHSVCLTKPAGLYNLFKIQAKDDIHCPPLTIMEHPSIIGDELAWLFSAMHDSSKVICSYSYQLRSHSVPHRDVFCFPSDPEIERKVSLSQLALPLCHDLLRINTGQSIEKQLRL